MILWHQGQGFSIYMLQKAFATEEESFKRIVGIVTRSFVLKIVNLISSHLPYKIRIDENNALKLKALITPHGNEDSIKQKLRTNCSMCAPLDVRIFIFIGTIFKWRLYCVDVKSAFLQTGPAESSVYVIPSQASGDRVKCIWLLLTATFGLINAIDKFQIQSDNLLFDLEIHRELDVLQFFMVRGRDCFLFLLATLWNTC